MNPQTQQQRKNVESLLSKMYKSYIPEIQEYIQEIHNKMKDYVGDHFFQIYLSSLRDIRSKIKNKLSREYSELFEKSYDDNIHICNLPPHNPYESPYSIIEREHARIERGWKAVHTKMVSIRKSFENHKTILLPIIECDLKGVDSATINAIEKIPYDSRYISELGCHITAPYTHYGQYGKVLKFNKFSHDKCISFTLDEMCKYGEKELLLEFIPIIMKVINITDRLRNLAREKCKKENPHYSRLSIHNSTGHIESGMKLHTLNVLPKINLKYPDIFSKNHRRTPANIP
jgi:hypothetical protein